MPPTPGVAEPFRLTPQIALRIAILGGIAIAVFGVLFFRLWALQVLSGPQYLHAAVNNQLRSIPLEAPRGPVLDREGRTIVDNRGATALQLWTADLPQTWSARLNELRRLSKIIDVPVSEMVAELKKRGGDPATPVTVQESVHQEQALYLQERAREFPGVDLAPTYLRNYPYQSLAAQVLGNVGLIAPSQYAHLRKKGYLLSDKIGQGGIEARYDAYLRGKDGLAQLRVDALGRPRSGLITEQSAQPGEAVRLTLDMNLQRAAERGIRAGIAAAHAFDGGAGFERGVERRAVGCQICRDPARGHEAVGLLTRVGPVWKPGHPIRAEQSQRIPGGRPPALADAAAFEQHVVVARVGEEAAGRESGLAGADDEGVSGWHGFIRSGAERSSAP